MQALSPESCVYNSVSGFRHCGSLFLYSVVIPVLGTGNMSQNFEYLN